MPDPLPLDSLNHIALMTRRLDESKAFWTQVMGFREVVRPNFDFRGAWLLGHGLMIHLLENMEAGDPNSEIQSRENHLALHTCDTGRVEQLLVAHGVRYRKSTLADTGIQQIFFQDPGGNVVEVGTYPPPPPFVA